MSFKAVNDDNTRIGFCDDKNDIDDKDLCHALTKMYIQIDIVQDPSALLQSLQLLFFLKKYLCVKLLSKLNSFPNISHSWPTLQHFDILMMIKIGFCNDCFPGFDSCLPVSHFILYQSAALPPLAAPAQTWKLTTANMNTFLASSAAAASVQIHIG